MTSGTRPPPAPGVPPRRRRWRRIARVLLALVALRLLLGLFLTPLVELALGASGLEAELGGSRLALHAARLELRDLVLRAPGGGRDVLTGSGLALRRLVADLDAAALLGGGLRVEALELDDLRVALRREESGRWPLLDALAGGPPADGPRAAPPLSPPDDGPQELDWPVEVESLVLHPLRLRVSDARPGAPTVDLEATLRLHGLVRGGTGLVELRCSGTGLDQLAVNADLAADGHELAASLSVQLAGLRPALLRPLLDAAGLRPGAALLEGRLGARLELRVTDAATGTLEGRLSAQDIAFSADGEERLALDRLDLPLVAHGPAGTRLGRVVLAGLRARLGRRADGALALPGVDLPPSAGGEAPEPAAPAPRAAPGAFALEGLRLDELRLGWFDEGTAPDGTLDLHLEALELGALDSAAPAATPLRLVLRGTSPPGATHALPLVERLTVEGQVTPLGPHPALDLALSASGLAGDALDPWLARAGWATDLGAATLDVRLAAAFERDASGTLRGEAALRELRLADGGERLRLAAVEARGVELAPDGALQLDSLHVSGPVLALGRDADGTLHLPGLRSVPVTPVAEPRADPPAPGLAAAAAPAAPPPVFGLGSLTWEGASCVLRDESVSPAVELVLAPRLQAEGLRFGGTQGPAGRATLSLDVPGAWGALELQAELRALDDPRESGVSLALALQDLHATALGGWLADAGLQAADLHANLRATANLQRKAGAMDLLLTDLRLTDGEAPLLDLPRVALLGLGSADGGTRIERVELAPAALHLGRDAEGVLALGRLRFAGRAQPEAPAAAASAPAAAPPAAPAPFALGQLALPRLSLHWSDASVAPPVELPLDLGLQVDGLVAGAPAPPAHVVLELRAPTVCEPLRVEGALALPPGGVEAQFALDAAGVRLDALRPYLGAGVEPELSDGRLRARLALASGAAAQGGTRFEMSCTELDWREAGAPEPLLALAALRLSVPRLDGAAGVLQVEELSLAGLAGTAERRAEGALALGGLVLRPPGEAPVAPAAPPAPAVASRRSLGALPLRDARIERLDLDLGPLRWRDASGPEPGQPLELRARLAAPEPLVLLDRSADDLAPARLELRASAPPLLRTLEADLFLDPGAARPGFALDLRAGGLRGAGLTEVAPALAATLDGSGLADGTLVAKLQAELSWPRRGPLDFDLSGGLSGDVRLSDLALRAQPDGEPLLGLQSLVLDLDDLRPSSGAIDLAGVELNGLLARVDVAPEGVTLGGLRLLPQPTAPDAAPEAAPPVPAPGPGGPPLRVDVLTASGLDLLVRDTTSTPPMLLPLRGLELELRGLTRNVKPAPPLRLTASLRGGEVPLPERHQASSLLAGVMGAAVDSLTGRPDAQRLQPRAVFDEIALQGRIEPTQPPRGWLNLSVSALELQAFAGPAARGGLVIGDGTLDASARLRLQGADGIHADTSLTFAHLSLSEPAGGPVSRWLSLPAPLDTVLFLLRNEDGEHVIKAGFEAPPGSLGTGRVARAASSAIGGVIGRAVASSPLRMLGTVTDLVGVTGGETAESAEPPLQLDFGPGDPLPPDDAAARLAPLVARLLDDEDLGLLVEHAFGGGDAERALLLANPPPEDALLLARRLRLLRDERLRTRDQLAAEARALHAVGRADEAAAATARVASEDRALGATEAALDRTLALLDAGAARRAPQRARATALEFGQARLDHVRALVARAGGEELARRVELRPVRYQPAEDSAGGQVSLRLVSRPTGAGLLDWLFGWIPDLFSASPSPDDPPAG